MYTDNVIRDLDIKYAERLLLPNNCVFDEERRDFLRNLKTIDLVAVPGSGKTTLLLAKLLILFKNKAMGNKGVLVLSHTNTAVNEIRNKLESHCPALFRRPNFVGTIQQFVNQYIAIPYYKTLYKKDITYIDAERFNDKIEWYYNHLFALGHGSLRGFLYNRNSKNNQRALKQLQCFRFDNDFNLIEGINGTSENFFLNKKTNSYKSILKIKKEVFIDKGILHYDDAYMLAHKALIDFPRIVSILQETFGFVFLDEAQDTATHQHAILDAIFIENNKSDTVYQRLGDPNQAIYDGFTEDKVNSWKIRKENLRVTGSHRLTEHQSRLLEKFAVSPMTIQSLNKARNIKPILYVFSQDACECEVIQTFVKDCKELFESSEEELNNIKVVGARKERLDKKGQLSLPNYCPNLQLEDRKPKGASLTYRDVFNSIMNYLVEFCYINNVKINDKNINKSTLRGLFNKHENATAIDIFLFEISRSFYLGFEVDTSIRRINEFAKRLPILCGEEYLDKYSFPNIDWISHQDKIAEDMQNDFICEDCELNGELIDITTVHSVKGETHQCTLFLETFYHKKYASDYFHKLFSSNKKLGELKNASDNMKNLSKVLYVALSRANTLCAYAMSQEQYDKYNMSNANIDIFDIKLL